MTLPLPANWTAGGSFTATAENNVESAVNALGNGSLVIPKNALVSSASTLTLTTSHNTYIYTGSAASTWTLPAVSGNTGAQLWLFNRGTSGAVTVAAAGTDHLYQTASVTSLTLYPGSSAQLLDDGTYWLVMPGYKPPPAFDGTAASTRVTPQNSGTATTWSHTVTNTSYGIVVWQETDPSFPNILPTTSGVSASVSLGGVGLSSLGYVVMPAYNEWLWVFGAPGIPVGTATASVTFTKSGQKYSGRGFSFTYSGVGSVSSLATATGSGNFMSCPITPITADPSLVWGAVVPEVSSGGLSWFLPTHQRVADSGFFYAGDQYTVTTDAFGISGGQYSASGSPFIGVALNLV